MAQKHQDNFYDGWLYHLFVDPVLRRVRRLVRDQVTAGSSLIDIGCGTGELLFSLADRCSELVGSRDLEQDVVLCESPRSRPETS